MQVYYYLRLWLIFRVWELVFNCLIPVLYIHKRVWMEATYDISPLEYPLTWIRLYSKATPNAPPPQCWACYTDMIQCDSYVCVAYSFLRRGPSPSSECFVFKLLRRVERSTYMHSWCFILESQWMHAWTELCYLGVKSWDQFGFWVTLLGESSTESWKNVIV